jgi:hypothetical protein
MLRLKRVDYRSKNRTDTKSVETIPLKVLSSEIDPAEIRLIR